MNWEWPVIVYLWVAGIAGGAYFAAFLANRLSGGQYQDARRIAAGLGIPAVILGVLMLVIDLGHPFRAWHLFVRFRPLSPMSLGSWLLFLWAALAVVLSLIWWAESFSGKASKGIERVVVFLKKLRPAVGVLDWIVFVFSILMIAYTGVLLGATGNPLWSTTILLPALFVSSAISTGIAALNLAGALGSTQVKPSLMSKLCKGSAVVCMVEILVLAGLLLWLLNPLATPVAYAAEGGVLCSEMTSLSASCAANRIITGELSFLFWVGVVLVGLVLPLGAEMSIILRSIERPPREILVLLTLMVLIGGLALRAAIVFGGQM